MTIRLNNIAGFKHRLPMTTAALAVVVDAGYSKRSGRVQIFANVEWLYSHTDEGATADNWGVIAAGQALTFDTGSAGFSFYAKTSSGSANIHVLEIG